MSLHTLLAEEQSGILNFGGACMALLDIEAGAISYLLKNVSADELASAIRAAHVGQPTLAPEATAALIHAVALALQEKLVN